MRRASWNVHDFRDSKFCRRCVWCARDGLKDYHEAYQLSCIKRFWTISNGLQRLIWGDSNTRQWTDSCSALNWIDKEQKTFETTELCFCSGSLAMLLFWEERRRDFYVMMVHRFVTVALIYFLRPEEWVSVRLLSPLSLNSTFFHNFRKCDPAISILDFLKVWHDTLNL